VISIVFLRYTDKAVYIKETQQLSQR